MKPLYFSPNWLWMIYHRLTWRFTQEPLMIYEFRLEWKGIAYGVTVGAWNEDDAKYLARFELQDYLIEREVEPERFRLPYDFDAGPVVFSSEAREHGYCWRWIKE